MTSARWYLGADLGRVRDSSALALVEPWGDAWALTWLKVWRPERTDCMDVLDEILRVVRSQRHAERPAVGIDARGAYRDVAAAALEGALVLEADVYPLLPSDSDKGARTRDDGWTWVGKRHLVESLRTAVSTRRLVLADRLAGAADFLSELRSLRLRPTRRRTGLTWSHPDQRAGSHDDIVSAVALAYFLAHTLTTQGLMDAIRPASARGLRCG